MANGPALSTARGGKIYVWNEIRDSISLLDVVYANQFEGQQIDPTLIEETEVNFYRGAPPQWLNFHISELEADTAPFIKRDGYETLKSQIQESRKLPGISTVKLFHQPGSGGTTMAMQVLWDFRETFRCAVMTDSASDITNVAMQVVNLFTAGSRNYQNTVLLLVNDEEKLEDLQKTIMKTIAEQEIVTRMPVVTLLSCVRKDVVLQNDQVVLKAELSDGEKQEFNKKMKKLREKYDDKYKQFHGFSIMQTNFSQAYIEEACTVLDTVQKANRPLKNQLVAFLSLLNAYVPGSYLLESQCLDFLRCKYGSLEDEMEPFSDLMITFQQDERSEKKVRMVHRLLAKHCTNLMAAAGVTRSDTARNFLNNFCRNEVPSFLLGFVRDMLRKRENNEQGNEEKFSRLILDIEYEENKAQSASVLKVASKKFDQNPFFPQALARFSYLEQQQYNKAEMWAKRAQERDPRNSFVADTLGQVHKNRLKNHLKEHLKRKEFTATPRQILQLAEKAIKAFKHEEQLAEEEQGEDMREDGTAKISNVFNSRGQFGYLQVCITLFNLLVRHNINWKSVLTKKVSMCSALPLLGDNKLYRFNDLISSLRDEVERKGDFFEKYLTYSKLSMEKDDPDYISKDTEDCCSKYVGDSEPNHIHPNGTKLIQNLEQSLPDRTHVELLSYVVRDYTQSELKRWRRSSSSTDLVNNMLADFRQKIPLSPMDAPELHMLSLLLCWPENEDRCNSDLNQLIGQMHSSYDHVHKKYFRSRYLRPLFFIGKGQDLNRIVHREQLVQSEETPEESNAWRNDSIFKTSSVKELLLRVEGVVRKYKVYAVVGGKEIQVDANWRNSLWKPRPVSFYLGFTIRGPVAFDIQTKTPETGSATASDQHSADQHGTTQANDVGNPGANADGL